MARVATRSPRSTPSPRSTCAKRFASAFSWPYVTRVGPITYAVRSPRWRAWRRTISPSSNAMAGLRSRKPGRVRRHMMLDEGGRGRGDQGAAARRLAREGRGRRTGARRRRAGRRGRRGGRRGRAQGFRVPVLVTRARGFALGAAAEVDDRRVRVVGRAVRPQRGALRIAARAREELERVQAALAGGVALIEAVADDAPDAPLLAVAPGRQAARLLRLGGPGRGRRRLGRRLRRRRCRAAS